VRGAAPAIELADQVGAQEGQRIRQDADGELQGADVNEARDADDVEHRHRADEDAGQHQKDPLAPLVQPRIDVVVRKDHEPERKAGARRASNGVVGGGWSWQAGCDPALGRLLVGPHAGL